MMYDVLIVDDDPDIVRLVSLVLERAGIPTATAATGAEALERLQLEAPKLIILDLMMDELDGFELLHTLRECGNEIPVLLLSAINDDMDKVRGFHLGADDYVTKPFSSIELVARVQARIRRQGALQAPMVGNRLLCGGFRLELDTQTLYKNEVPISLSSTETALIAEFLKQPGIVFTKLQLFQAVWKHSRYDDNVLNVYISRLRQKVEPSPKQPQFVQTVWGIGYRFEIGETTDAVEN